MKENDGRCGRKRLEEQKTKEKKRILTIIKRKKKIRKSSRCKKMKSNIEKRTRVMEGWEKRNKISKSEKIEMEKKQMNVNGRRNERMIKPDMKKKKRKLLKKKTKKNRKDAVFRMENCI